MCLVFFVICGCWCSVVWGWGLGWYVVLVSSVEVGVWVCVVGVLVFVFGFGLRVGGGMDGDCWLVCRGCRLVYIGWLLVIMVCFWVVWEWCSLEFRCWCGFGWVVVGYLGCLFVFGWGWSWRVVCFFCWVLCCLVLGCYVVFFVCGCRLEYLVMVGWLCLVWIRVGFWDVCRVGGWVVG